MDEYRTRIAKVMPADVEGGTQFKMEHFNVYSEILAKLPTTKIETGVLTEHEKRVIKEELQKVKKSAIKKQIQILDGSDSSLSMIHMIFHFFL